MRLSAASVLLAGALGLLHVTAAQNLTDFVDLVIGEGGTGFGISQIPPGPQVPFGALRLSPDTSIGLEPFKIKFNEYGGYYYDNPYIECFSHTHVDGAGAGDWQNFGVTVTRQLTDATVTNAGYRSTFTHDNEVFAPGYYAVNLDTAATFAEVTACSEFAGRHRYTCRSAGEGACFLVLDICHVSSRTFFNDTEACKEARINGVTTDAAGVSHVSASVFNAGSMTGRAHDGGVWVHFTMELTATDSGSGATIPLTASSWLDGQVSSDATVSPVNTTSQSLGVAFSAGTPSFSSAIVFDVAVAISFVSPASAASNFAAALVGPDGAAVGFDACRAAGRAQWEAVLRQFDLGAQLPALAAARRDELAVFYTAVYHAHMSPTTYSEANGEFLGFGGTVHNVGPGTNATGGFAPRHVSDLSLWDTYRSHAPLMALVQPDMARDTVNSMLSMYETSGGHFPVWPMANMDTHSMVGIHGTVVAGDDIRKGIRGINVSAVVSAVATSITRQTRDRFGDLGYEPFEHGNSAASDTLDYALDAASAAELCRWLQDDACDMSLLMSGALAYTRVWDAESQMICPRLRNGTFECQFPYTPYGFGGKGYTEGDAEQYRWYVPTDPYGLVALYKSPEYFAQQLYDFHALALRWPLNTTIPNPFFWAGNEPTFLTPFLFNYAGNQFAHLTQHFVPVLDDAYFFAGPAGVPGNDDYGAMSSWLTFGYLGLYPAASSTNYTLFVPRFDNVTLRVGPRGAAASPFGVVAGGGAVLRLVAHGRPAGAAPGAVYLANASVNGVPLPTPFVTHEQLLAQRGADGVAQVDFYLSGEATVFGAAAPSAGGPAPWQPSEADAAEAAALVERLASEASGRDAGEGLRRRKARGAHRGYM